MTDLARTAAIVGAAGLIVIGLAAKVAFNAWRDTKRAMRRARRRSLIIAAAAWLWRKVKAGGSGGRQRRRPPTQPLEGDDMWAACTLTPWGKGFRDLFACRVCNQRIPEGRNQFCGHACKDWARENHYFDDARSARRKLDGYRCVQCGKSGPDACLEVDHITAVLGRHKVPGCWHHLEGLRTLCGGGGRSCHQKRTNQQRRAGEFGRGRRAS